MTPSKTMRACRLWLPVLVLLCLAPHALAAAPADAGWRQFQQNRNAAARTTFQAVLKQNPNDLDALRGLGLVQQQEDNEVAALAAWRQLYRVAPAHWAAAAYWPQVSELAQETGRWDLLEAAARDILAAKGVLPALRASARLALAQAMDRKGRAGEAGQQWAALGYVCRWEVIGPFDNSSQSGFDKVYPPEREVSLGTAYAGKNDLKLHWQPLTLVGRDGQCAVGGSLGDSDANIFYAVTAIQSPRAQAARLQFDPSGASKVFVNGQLASADALSRIHVALLADPFAIPVTLRAGWNTILVKLSDDDKLAGAFSLRVTAPDGAALASLPVNPMQAQRPGTIAAPTADTPLLGAATVSLLRQQPLNLETAGLLGANLRLARDYSASEEVLHQGLAAAPDCGWLHWQLAQTLTADGQDDDARAERDLALKQNPNLVEAALEAVAEDEDTVSPNELIARAQAALRLNPASPDALWLLSRAYSNAKLRGESLKAARQAVAQAPGVEARLQLIKMEEDQDKKADAVAALTQALRATPADVGLLEARADMLAGQDSDAASLALYQRLLALNPTDTSYRVTLSRLYQELHRPDASVQSLRLARAQRPQDADICAALADQLQDGGKTPEAIALYQEAIRLDPSQLTLRDKRAVLSGEKPVLDLVPATDGSPTLAVASRLPGEPGASAILLLDEAREVVYPDYATLIRYHQIIKILDESAAQRYQQYPLARSTSTADATVESARLIKPDGKVQDVTESAGRDGVPFPSLSPGDVIDVTYRVEDYHRGGLAHQFWEQWSFNVPDAPSRLSRYVLITPPAMAFGTQAHGAIPAPSVKDISGWRVHEWRMTDVPPRKSELMGTGFTDAAIWLDISTVTSWTQIVDWYRDLSRPRCVPDAAIRAKAALLTKDAKTEGEKIQALQGFVAREIQYQSSPFRLSAYVPTEGKQVIRECYGDCKDKAALLTALLAAVGIKSDMVLLSPRNHGLTPYLPSPRFNHAIARVQTAQGPLWVDATADQLEYGALPPDDQQVPALVIDDATTGLTVTPTLPIDHDRSTETYAGTLGTDGTLRGSFTWTLTGSPAWQLRSGWRNVPESKNDEMMQSLAAYLIKNATFESGGFENLTDLKLPLGLHLQYHVEHFSTPAGSFLLVPLFWNAESQDKTVTALLANSTRTEDLEAANSRGSDHSVVRLTLPAGYVPQEMPADVHQESPFGAYRITYRMDGNVLEATREITSTAMRVAAKDVPKYAAFFQAEDQDSERQIVLKKQ